MLVGIKKPLRHCTPSDLIRHSDVLSVRVSQAQRTYSVGLLEEAYQLSKKIGIAKAAKMAGINLNSLRHYCTIRKREDGTAGKQPAGFAKITPDQKKKCHAAYLRLYSRGFSKSMRKCWIEAGKQTGVNGRSVEFQYTRGLWKP
jgi:hypothetical protein